MGHQGNHEISRRLFVRTAVAGLAAGALAPNTFASSTESQLGAAAARPGAASWPARVVSVHSPAAFKGSQLDPQLVSEMLDVAAGELCGGAGKTLWPSLFTPDDVAGIKLNCISRTVKPNKPLIDAVVAGLKSAGVRENNIIVWDRFEEQLSRRAKLAINRGTEGVRIYGTETPTDALAGYDPDVFYETGQDTPEYRASTGRKSLVSRIVTRDCTKIINMPVLKDHNQAGITGCLKNLAFGAINNTARFHKAPMYCSPAIADVMSIPAIRNKTVLHVLDALRVCYNGGPDASNPAYITNLSTIYLATDPVACDTIALEAVQELRSKAGLGDLFQTSGHPSHIADAAKKGLGTGDRDNITVIDRAL